MPRQHRAILVSFCPCDTSPQADLKIFKWWSRRSSHSSAKAANLFGSYAEAIPDAKFFSGCDESANDVVMPAMIEINDDAGRRDRRAATPASAQASSMRHKGCSSGAVNTKLARSDPALNVEVKLKLKRKGGCPPWTDDDMAKFEAR